MKALRSLPHPLDKTRRIGKYSIMLKQAFIMKGISQKAAKVAHGALITRYQCELLTPPPRKFNI
jgi:hypothetical protein